MRRGEHDQPGPASQPLFSREASSQDKERKRERERLATCLAILAGKGLKKARRARPPAGSRLPRSPAPYTGCMRKAEAAVDGAGREAAAAVVAAELEDSAGKAAAAAAAPPVLSPLSETLWRDRAEVLLGDVSARLAWRDLTVTVALGTGDTQAVLQGLTGHAEPGTITALMGPSGSGKSTLLDALAGRLAANAFLAGTVLLNGRKANLSFGAAVRTPSSCRRLVVTLTH